MINKDKEAVREWGLDFLESNKRTLIDIIKDKEKTTVYPFRNAELQHLKEQLELFDLFIEFVKEK